MKKCMMGTEQPENTYGCIVERFPQTGSLRKRKGGVFPLLQSVPCCITSNNHAHTIEQVTNPPFVQIHHGYKQDR